MKKIINFVKRQIHANQYGVSTCRVCRCQYRPVDRLDMYCPSCKTGTPLVAYVNDVGPMLMTAI